MMPRTAPAELKPDVRLDRALARRRRRRGGQGRARRDHRVPARSRRASQRLGARVPRGVLLHGPPGTGKTLLAKAVAAESGAAFFSQPASAFVEMFAGLGASRIRKLFDTARKHAPGDRLHRRARRRRRRTRSSSVGFNREQDQTLNQLLVELDGFRPLGRRDHGLDEPPRHARRRAPAARAASTARSTSRRPTCSRASRSSTCTCATSRSTPRSTCTAIARTTAGLTGADLENICNEAAIRATTRRPRRRSRRSTSTTRSSASWRACKTHRTVSEDEKRIIAYHEAGHALLAHIVGTRHDHPQGHDRAARRRARLQPLHLPTDERSWPRATTSSRASWCCSAGAPARRSRSARSRTAPADDLERSHGHRPRDGVRLGPRRVAHDAHRARATTTPSRRRPSGCATRSSRRSATPPTPRPSGCCGEPRRARAPGEQLLERETLDREDVATMLHDVQRVGTLAFSRPGGPLSARHAALSCGPA